MDFGTKPNLREQGTRQKLQCLSWSIFGCHTASFLQYPIGYRGQITDTGLPSGTVVKNPPANAGDTGSSPDLGRSHKPWSN